MKEELPKGTRVLFHDLSPHTTEQDLQDLIAQRTGIVIPLDRISIRPHSTRNSSAISLDWTHVVELLAWALGEDSLHGLPIRIIKPESKAA